MKKKAKKMITVSEIIKGKTILEVEELNNLEEALYFTDGSKLVIEAVGWDAESLAFSFVESQSHIDTLREKLKISNEKMKEVYNEREAILKLLNSIEDE